MTTNTETSTEAASLRERATEAYAQWQEKEEEIKRIEWEAEQADNARHLKSLLMENLDIDAEPTSNEWEADGITFTYRSGPIFGKQLLVAYACPECGQTLLQGPVYRWDDLGHVLHGIETEPKNDLFHHTCTPKSPNPSAYPAEEAHLTSGASAMIGRARRTMDDIGPLSNGEMSGRDVMTTAILVDALSAACHELAGIRQTLSERGE